MGYDHVPDPTVVDRLSREPKLSKMLKLQPNVLGVAPFLCPVLNHRVYVPCRRKRCVLYIPGLPRFLNCGYRYAESVAGSGWSPRRQVKRLSIILNVPAKEMTKTLNEALTGLARLYFRDYLATHRTAYERSIRACCFCYSSRGVALYRSPLGHVCVECDPLPRTAQRELRALEDEFGTSAAVAIVAARDLFSGSGKGKSEAEVKDFVRRVLRIKPSTLNLVWHRLFED